MLGPRLEPAVHRWQDGARDEAEGAVETEAVLVQVDLADQRVGPTTNAVLHYHHKNPAVDL